MRIFKVMQYYRGQAYTLHFFVSVNVIAGATHVIAGATHFNLRFMTCRDATFDILQVLPFHSTVCIYIHITLCRCQKSFLERKAS